VFLVQSENADPEPAFRLFERRIIRLDFDVGVHRPDVFRLLRKYADPPMSVANAVRVSLVV
jgi:hypothetical protein